MEETYARKRKQLDEDSFDKIWKVMSMERYDIIREASSRDGKQYEWWKDEPTSEDEDLITDEFKYNLKLGFDKVYVISLPRD